MSNVNSPFGFQPLMVELSGAPSRTRQYGKPASDSNAIFQWDLLQKVTGGIANELAPAGNLVPTVQSGTQGTPGTTYWIGVAINYGKASTLTYHTVIDGPNALFRVQADSTVIATGSHIGKNANVTNNAGSTTTGLSAMVIAGAGIATTNTLDLRLMKVSDIVPNAEGAYAIVEVTINKHELGKGIAGV